MRQARIKVEGQDTWYHCYNHAVGFQEDRPFGAVEKEKFIRILKRVSTLYSIRIVAYQVMSNHFHILLQAPKETPSQEDMCRRFAAFHNGKRTLLPGTPACRRWQQRSRDISWFMRHLQQLFTLWYNRTQERPRRGPLWSDRFKNTLLQDGMAVWKCLCYIENNAARAGLIKKAYLYRFGSLAPWRHAGRHPFHDEAVAALIPLTHLLFGINDMNQVLDLLQQTLSRNADNGGSDTFKSARYWTMGVVIGSELFVREVISVFRQYKRSTPRHINERMATGGICAWQQRAA